ncbi:MAG: hypothetical protein AAB410_01420 [Patescibacteria group bacterium]
MSLEPKKQITILCVSTASSAFSLASILNFTDPHEASWLVFAFFYLSIFLLCFGLFSLLAFGVKRWLWPKIYLNDLSTSLRQGMLLALFLTFLVILQISGILFWWLELCLILFFIALEIFINLKK